jgi:hypothetical protein
MHKVANSAKTELSLETRGNPLEPTTNLLLNRSFDNKLSSQLIIL